MALGYQSSKAIRYVRFQKKIPSHELSGSSRKCMSPKRGKKAGNEKTRDPETGDSTQDRGK